MTTDCVMTSSLNSEFEYDTDEDNFDPPASSKVISLLKSISEFDQMYEKSIQDPESFWFQFVDDFYWHRKPSIEQTVSWVFESPGPRVSWFSDGLTNMCYNCVDRHVSQGHGSEIAFDWVGNNPDHTLTYTYAQILEEICALSAALLSYGIKPGDVVAIYSGMVPETLMMILACCRIGAIHMVVFGGYSADALATRIIDSKARILFTIDECYRATKPIEMKKIAETAVEISRLKHQVEMVIVKKHSNRFSKQGNNSADPGKSATYVDYDQFITNFRGEKVDPVWLPADSSLFVLHTSGSTGKPKGIVHALAGYMVYTALTFKYTFNITDGDVLFCTGDLGWITGHTYNCYGPLLCRTRFLMHEGIVTYPDPGFCWRLCEKYDVTHLYTAPTAVRALQKHGDAPVSESDLRKLRVIGTVGEPISATAWSWLYDVVGKKGACAIVDTYFLTEAGGHLITTFPGLHSMKPSSAGKPFFGVEPAIVDEDGNELVERNKSVEGYLVFKQPWPGMMRSIFGQSHEVYREKYFSRFGGKYFFTGDGAIRDHDGYYWISGRVDDMMNCSGHLLSSAEIENVLSSDPYVHECAVVAVPHPIKGFCGYAFVVPKTHDIHDQHNQSKRMIGLVREKIGPFAAPDKVIFVSNLPKTRSGKLMRRILRHLCLHRVDFGDVSALTEPDSLKVLVEEVNEQIGKGKTHA